MNELARVAADSIGASKCVFIKKHTEGIYNKAYILSMEDGQEVVAKVPNPKCWHSTLSLILWDKAVPTRCREEAHCFGMVPTDN